MLLHYTHGIRRLLAKTSESKAARKNFFRSLSSTTDEKSIDQGEDGNGVDVRTEGKMFRITLNRPDKFNALTWQMYEDLIGALEKSQKDKATSITVLTGTGPYYSSGNDLSNFAAKTPEEMQKLADDGEKILERFVTAHIMHEKPLISLINGPAIGIVVTTLPLFDLVLASTRATFATPFTTLGQSPEGTSSYTFPLLMGPTKASEVLIFNKKLMVEEALDRNLVTRVIPHENFQNEAERYVKTISELPPDSLRVNKTLLRDVHRDALLATNAHECRILKMRWLSAECQEAIKSFMSRKK